MRDAVTWKEGKKEVLKRRGLSLVRERDALFFIRHSIFYTVSPKIVPSTHNGNFIKSQRIFKILLLLEREGNFQCAHCTAVYYGSVYILFFLLVYRTFHVRCQYGEQRSPPLAYNN